MDTKSAILDDKQVSMGVGTTPRRKGRWVRCILRTLLALLLLLVVALVAAIIWLGPIAEYFVEKYDRELVGRELTMDNLQIKLFGGRVEVDNLAMYEEDGVEKFASIGHLSTTIDLGDIFDSHIHITTVELSLPVVNIIHSGEVFNFDTLIAYILDTYVGDDVTEESDEGSWRISVENVALNDGTLAYYDTVMDQHWDLTMLSVNTPAIYLGDATTEVDASMVINNKAAFEASLGANLSTLDFTAEGSLSDFDIADTYKYIIPAINLRDLQGKLSANVTMEGNLNEVLATTIKGAVAASNLSILGPDGGNLFSAGRVDASVEEINIDAQRFILSTFTAVDYATELHFRKDGTTNFNMLFYGEPEVSVETTATAVGDDMYEVQERVTVTTSDDVAPFSGVTLRITLLDLQNGELTYSDKTMHEDFDYMLRKIAICADNFDLMGRNKVTLRMSLPKQGSALLQWDGSLTDFYNQSLLAMLTNVDMKGLSTYLEHFTAFPITSGNMTFRSQNIVTNGKLSGINQLGTYQFELGKKNKELDAEYKLPLKFGLFVLTDKNDHIDVDFPITGNIDAPEFSYRKIILKAIGNLLLKIVAAPFEWMSKDKQDAFRHIDIELLNPGLDSEHYARIDKMVETLREDESLKVRLTQRVDYERAVQRISDLNLKMAYYNATQGSESGYLGMVDYTRIKDLRISGKAVSKFADSLLTARGVDPAHMSVHAKAQRLYGDAAVGQLRDIMRFRNRIIMEYVAFQHSDISPETFVINDVVMEDMENYKGKDRYTVTLVVDDEEVEVTDTTTEESIDEDYYDAYALEEDDGMIVEPEGDPLVAEPLEGVAVETESIVTENME